MGSGGALARAPPRAELSLLQSVLLVGLGGAIGSILRFLTSLAAAQWLGADFPYGTLIVNLLGSFVIGFAQELGGEALMIPEGTRLFVTTGMMGGLTTYSTFSYETVRLMETHAWTPAWVNVGLTTVCALLLCLLGIAAGRLLIGLRG